MGTERIEDEKEWQQEWEKSFKTFNLGRFGIVKTQEDIDRVSKEIEFIAKQMIIDDPQYQKKFGKETIFKLQVAQLLFQIEDFPEEMYFIRHSSCYLYLKKWLDIKLKLTVK
jgi:hypothetical protein